MEIKPILALPDPEASISISLLRDDAFDLLENNAGLYQTYRDGAFRVTTASRACETGQQVLVAFSAETRFNIFLTKYLTGVTNHA